ncbi:MAG: DUF4179 domain-containing protein [Oscillospiraceae bacterium]|nr:DUF4179 domain-containing protein [Oscillospiraceae bacterium]
MRQLYKQTFDKIAMDPFLERKILSTVTSKHSRMINVKKLIPIAAAALCLTGGITAAAIESDIIKTLFGVTDQEEITGELRQMEGHTDNLILAGDDNMTVTPAGMIGDDKNIYCVFDLTTINDDLKSDSHYSFIEGPNEMMLINGEPALNTNFGCMTDTPFFTYQKTDHQLMIFAKSESSLSFHNSDKITFPVSIIEWPNEAENNIAPVHSYCLEFTINFEPQKKNRTICIDKTIDCIMNDTHYSLHIDEITVSGFGYTVRGTSNSFECGFDTSAISDKGEKISTRSSQGLNPGLSGGSASLNSGGKYDLTLDGSFSVPVMPDSITEIDIGGTRIVLSDYPE